MSDGTDRRGLLKCMAWVGTGVVWTIAGGVPRSLPIEQAEAATLDDLLFAQISDSHIGFNKDANTDVPGTVKAGIDRIRALPKAPAFMLHTGDISHL
jgi:Icc protein